MNKDDILKIRSDAIKIAKERMKKDTTLDHYEEDDLSFEVILKEYGLYVVATYCYQKITTETVFWKDLE